MKKNHVLAAIVGSIFVSGILIAPLGNYVRAASNPIQIVSEKGIISSDVAPYVLHGVTLVPINVINKLGKSDSKVTWDNASKTATVTTPNKKITLQINQKYAMQNGKQIALSQSAILKDGRVMVPLRFIGESIGEKVNWDATYRVVSVGNVSTATNEAIASETLRKSRESVLGLNTVSLGTELPTIGIQTLIRYFPVGKSDVYFDSTDDLITYYKIENNKRYEIWSANYKMEIPAKNEGLPFFPYKITKEIGKRPIITTSVAYYRYQGAISDLHYGLIDTKAKETELGHTDPAQTKEYFPVSKEELALVK